MARSLGDDPRVYEIDVAGTTLLTQLVRSPMGRYEDDVLAACTIAIPMEKEDLVKYSQPML